MDIKEIIRTLNSLHGIANVHVLTIKQKLYIKAHEQQENTGVHTCVQQPTTLVCTHDETFREPAGLIVKKDGPKTIFPPVPFPEIPNSISSSPSNHIHNYLVKTFKLILKNKEATLLIGISSR
ncbi:hypothetical protein CL622_08140 [archaeon]|nr:hypothetical protein [archaeon]|tara:strand:+ start:518 stop:886 length:369 start_codon:yes stop_codon:yes gene_type:complete